MTERTRTRRRLVLVFVLGTCLVGSQIGLTAFAASGANSETIADGRASASEFENAAKFRDLFVTLSDLGTDRLSLVLVFDIAESTSPVEQTTENGTATE